MRLSVSATIGCMLISTACAIPASDDAVDQAALPALTKAATQDVPTQDVLAQDVLTGAGNSIVADPVEQVVSDNVESALTSSLPATLILVSDEDTGPDEQLTLEGSFSQAGVLFGQTIPGATVRLDGTEVMVDDDGRFVIGFGRDSSLIATLTVTYPDGRVETRQIDLEDRQFPEQRIDGLDQSKVSGFTKEQLAKIGVDRDLKKKARARTHENADWAAGFDWPVTGRISGVFGSRRILNGEPKRPHSGVDVARPTGTPIRAPAGGIIRLAEDDMYFEGGLVLLDHGHWLESAFLHMSKIEVEPGQRVEKGDIIGEVGATGRVTGPHLHWSVRWMSRLVDPQLLAGDMPQSETKSE